jgi:hypothetical protein
LFNIYIYIYTSIKRSSQINDDDIKAYFGLATWKKVLHRHYKEIDLTATFTEQCNSAFAEFMTQAFRRMVEEKLGLVKNFLDMSDLNKLTIGLDLYDNTGTLDLNNKDFKALLVRELPNLIEENKV